MTTVQDKTHALNALRFSLARRDDRETYTSLVSYLGWPRGKRLKSGELGAGIELLGELAMRQGSPLIADMAAVVARDLYIMNPNVAGRLYDLGYVLIDGGAPAIAATVLWHLLEIEPTAMTLCELVSALESMQAYDDALAVLDEHAELREDSFLLRYLTAFNAAMTGRIDVTRAMLPALADERADLIDPTDTALTFRDADDRRALRETIVGIVDRADYLGTGRRESSDWHYIMTGGLLFGGHSAELRDSTSAVMAGIDRLSRLVDRTRIPCIYVLPGRDNEIFARAVSARLGIDLEPWPGTEPGAGLVAIYDLATLDINIARQLVRRDANQILYAHAAPWTHDSPVAPDVTALLYQTLRAPWDSARPIADVVAELTAHADTGQAVSEWQPASACRVFARASGLVGPASRDHDAAQGACASEGRRGPRVGGARFGSPRSDVARDARARGRGDRIRARRQEEVKPCPPPPTSRAPCCSTRR